MSYTKRQKKKLRIAEFMDKFFGKGTISAREVRADVRRAEKKKREQFRGAAR